MKKEPTTILCYGDSNTYGKDPETSARLGYHDRWTNLLAKHLGDDFNVIEEGLCGRTIIFDDEDPARPCCNGYTMLAPLLASHNPDYLVVMLGTNDTRYFNNASPDEIVNHLSHYIKLCQKFSSRLILIAPCPASSGFIDPITGLSANQAFNFASYEKMQKLPAKMAEFAKKHKLDFINPAAYTKTGQDHLHWDKQSHKKFAYHLSEYIKNL